MPRRATCSPIPPKTYPLIYAFITGFDADGNPQFAAGQHNVIDTIPGDAGYSAFWDVNLVKVPAGYQANSITSVAGVTQSGFEVVHAGKVVNCPVVRTYEAMMTTEANDAMAAAATPEAMTNDAMAAAATPEAMTNEAMAAAATPAAMTNDAMAPGSLPVTGWRHDCTALVVPRGRRRDCRRRLARAQAAGSRAGRVKLLRVLLTGAHLSPGDPPDRRAILFVVSRGAWSPGEELPGQVDTAFPVCWPVRGRPVGAIVRDKLVSIRARRYGIRLLHHAKENVMKKILVAYASKCGSTGKVDHTRLEQPWRLMASLDKSGVMADGDWRDWDAIRAWAGDVVHPVGGRMSLLTSSNLADQGAMLSQWRYARSRHDRGCGGLSRLLPAAPWRVGLPGVWAHWPGRNRGREVRHRHYCQSCRQAGYRPSGGPWATTSLVYDAYAGMLTGVTEVLMTWLLLSKTRLGHAPWRNALAFGVGFGVFEALLLGLSSLAVTATALFAPASLPAEAMNAIARSNDILYALAPATERTAVIFVHIFCNALLFYGVMRGQVRWMWVSFVYKSLLDSVAGFAQAVGRRDGRQAVDHRGVYDRVRSSRLVGHPGDREAIPAGGGPECGRRPCAGNRRLSRHRSGPAHAR